MLGYALITYATGMASIIALMLFLADVPIWKTVNQGEIAWANSGWHSNIVIVSVYFAIHSIMARPAFKRWWTRFVSPNLERATYILISGITTLVLIWCWQPVTALIWDIRETPYANLIYGIYGLGWLIGVSSTFVLDHLSFFGIKQSFTIVSPAKQSQLPFTIKFLYRFVRHPISLGWFIVFWAAPLMTAGHFILACMASLYIILVTPIEESDLVSEIGEEYVRYQKEVGKFLPVVGRYKG